MLAGVSFVGYAAVKYFGTTRGVLLAAVAGGLASSTAVTISNARRAAKGEGSPRLLAAGVALAYRRQLALYRALLAEIYPGRRVRAFLLWTVAPRLMEIDAETLDASMPYARVS